MTIAQELGKLRVEASFLRKQFATTWNAWQTQKQKNNTLEDKVKQLEQDKKSWDQERRDLQGAIKNLEDKLAALTVVKDKYQGMIFKAATPPPVSGKKRGGQTGHPGASRKKPMVIDYEKDVYLTNCPECDTPVPQTTATYERVVIDIPVPTAVVTRYTIQRQWCSLCHQEVCGIPEGTLPHVRFGTSFLSWLLFQKYRMRTPLAKIKELALTTYQLPITEGGLQNLLRQLQKQLGNHYQEILKEIRKAPVKYADETTWRVSGQHHWCWLFATPKAAYYTIEATRGQGVPKKILEGSPPEAVLVRDDYAGYNIIVANHQSCWSHLLRVSHDLATLPSASEESQELHQELTRVFGELDGIVQTPFNQPRRGLAYRRYTRKLLAIERRTYVAGDSRKVQARITRQHQNLLTALLYENVPLTNNHAERQIRPMAVTRKISGGSRSKEGAAIHAVLMSVVQTMSLRGQNILETLPTLLALPAHSYAVASEKGE